MEIGIFVISSLVGMGLGFKLVEDIVKTKLNKANKPKEEMLKQAKADTNIQRQVYEDKYQTLMNLESEVNIIVSNKEKQKFFNAEYETIKRELMKRLNNLVIHITHDTSMLMCRKEKDYLKLILNRFMDKRYKVIIKSSIKDQCHIFDIPFNLNQKHWIINEVHREIKEEGMRFADKEGHDPIIHHYNYLRAKDNLAYMKELRNKHNEIEYNAHVDFKEENQLVFQYHRAYDGFNSRADGIIISKAWKHVNDKDNEFSVILSDDLDVKQIVVETEFFDKLYSNYNLDKLFRHIDKYLYGWTFNEVGNNYYIEKNSNVDNNYSHYKHPDEHVKSFDNLDDEIYNVDKQRSSNEGLRVYELARELKITNKEVLDTLSKLRIDVVSHISLLNKVITDMVRNEYK